MKGMAWGVALAILAAAGAARAAERVGGQPISLTTDESSAGFVVELRNDWGIERCDRPVTRAAPEQARARATGPRGSGSAAARGSTRSCWSRTAAARCGCTTTTGSRRSSRASSRAAWAGSGVAALAAGLRGGAPCRDERCSGFLVEGGYVLALLGLGFGIPTTILGFTLAGPTAEVGPSR